MVDAKCVQSCREPLVSDAARGAYVPTLRLCVQRVKTAAISWRRF